MSSSRPSLVVICVAALAGASNIAQVRAQSPDAVVNGPAFEVASVKLNKMLDARRGASIQPGRFVRTAIPLRQLINVAYDIAFHGRDVVGGPEWVDSDRFDIEGRGDFTLADYLPTADGSPGLVYQMLRTLLAERFKLVIHAEAREQPIFALVMANRDGKLGPQLKRSNVDCDAVLRAFAKNGKWQPALEPGKGPPCSRGGPEGRLVVEDLSMFQIAAILSGSANRVVKDQTGLTGNFDLTLEWAPDEAALNAGGVSIFTAMQEQLGLKFESQRGPVEVIVIDQVERPTPD